MEIEGNIEVNGWTRPCDMETGDTFVCEDDQSSIWLTCDLGYVNLSDNTIENEDSIDYDVFAEKVVRKINCKVVVLEE